MSSETNGFSEVTGQPPQQPSAPRRLPRVDGNVPSTRIPRVNPAAPGTGETPGVRRVPATTGTPNTTGSNGTTPPVRPPFPKRSQTRAIREEAPVAKPTEIPANTEILANTEIPANTDAPTSTGVPTTTGSQPTVPVARRTVPTRPTAKPSVSEPPAITGSFEDTTTTGMRSRRLEAERRNARRRQRNRKLRTAVILSLVVAILGACLYFAYNALRSTSTEVVVEDYPGPGTSEVVAVVNPGDTGAVIADELVRLDVVKSPEAFIRAWEANQAATSVQPGSYTLKLQMSGSDAVAALLDPTNRTSNAISIPSGFTVWQVKERMKAHPNLKPEEVEAAFNDVKSLGLPAEAKGNLEGWLFPGSYEVHQNDTPQQVLQTMIGKTVDELNRLKVPADQRQTVLIKASILEREVSGPTYMKQVARVIENRLNKPEAETVGLLQMDSTVNYGLKRAGGIPSGDEVKQDTPYNTYIHKGLPPTPISMPSAAAVEATLNPAQGEWLYFVTVDLKTGETKFASTVAEHDNYVKELKAWCAANKGSC